MNKKPEGVLLLAFVCLLLVVVLGAVESGRIEGANYGNGLPVPGLNFTLPWRPGTNSVNPVANNGTSTNGTSRPTAPPPSQVISLPFVPTSLPATLAPLGWLLAALAVGGFAGICFLMLRARASVRVVDLNDTLKEMDLQKKYLSGTWSSKMRNAALLRYYVLMRRACARAGFPEEKAETPQEYIGRVSSALEVESSEAGRFADAVNRSRYGEELSQEDAHDASTFMGTFTNVIRRKAGAI